MKKKNKINYVREIINFLYYFLFPLINFIAKFFSKATSFLYYLLMNLDWGRTNRPEWMDHDQDHYYQFYSNGSFFYLERAILPRLFMSNFLTEKSEFKNLKPKKKLNILDLCSGDSYMSQKFFFDTSNIIVSLDLDPSALARGKNRIRVNKYMNKKHYFYEFDVEKEKIKYFLKKKKLNIKFDIVLFNAAIEHFKKDQLDFIFFSLKDVMSKKSFISCYTIIECKNKNDYLPGHHEMFFSSSQDLKKIISKHFKYTKIYNSLHNNRHNIYCIGSNNKIKF